MFANPLTDIALMYVKKNTKKELSDWASFVIWANSGDMYLAKVVIWFFTDFFYGLVGLALY